MGFRFPIVLGLMLVVVLGSIGSTHAQAAGTASSDAATPQTLLGLTFRGTSALSHSSGGASSDLANERLRSGLPEVELPGARVHTIDNSAPTAPNPARNPITTDTHGIVAAFNGLTHRDQRLAGTGAYAGTQFSLEPPDQGLCVGGGFVVETINTAVRVRSPTGAFLTEATAINQFFGLKPEVIRPSGPFGEFTGDVKCYFDRPTARFFLSTFEIDVVADTGEFGNRAAVLFAVTQTIDPTGSWNLFSLDATNDGTEGTPSHPNCPCFGDQPLIGADANGFYVSTNEYSLHPFGGFFNGAQVYAMSKAKLAAGLAPPVVLINAGEIPTPDVGGIWYTLQPATTPPGGSYASGNRGTEFFLSALQFFFDRPLDNRIAVWALTNTRSLDSDSPKLSLSVATIASETYGQPPNARQKDGPRPLGTVTIPAAGGKKEKLELLAGNDDRMNQVVFANGLLWGGVNTVVQSSNPNTVAIAYFVVAPRVSRSGQVSGSVVQQGYIAPEGASALFPSIGVTPDGTAVMTFTLVGKAYFPSAAYAIISGGGDGNHNNGPPAVHIVAAGTAPEDGFSGYVFFGGNGVARWGDYSAAVAGDDGKIWFVTEYIPDLPRTVNANWGTFIAAFEP